MAVNAERYRQARVMLCQYLRERAREKGITYEAIAEKTGFTQSNVSRMLSGKFSPSLDNFMRLADAIEAYFFVIDKDEKETDLVKMMKNRWGEPGQN